MEGLRFSLCLWSYKVPESIFTTRESVFRVFLRRFVLECGDVLFLFPLQLLSLKGRAKT